MTVRPPARGRVLAESALGALLGALLVHAGLRVAGVLSPTGTVAVPVLAFPVSTFVVFVLRIRATGPDRSRAGIDSRLGKPPAARHPFFPSP